MNTPFNNNLPTQTGDVKINPVNPDSKTTRCRTHPIPHHRLNLIAHPTPKRRIFAK
jgi:hypothetical protein